jgi:hypothetical protein
MIEELERGDLYFFYRPRVNVERVRGPEELDRVLVVLHPYDSGRYRLLALASNELPEVSEDPLTAWVDRVTDGAEDLVRELRGDAARHELDPKVEQGHHLGAARPCGEGVYCLFRTDEGTYLGYALELPESAGEVQDALGIHEQAVLKVAVRNPAAPDATIEGREVDFPAELEELFDERLSMPVNPPSLLDHEGAVLVLTADGAGTTEEFGVELDPERESLATSEFVQDLGLRPADMPVEPLISGEWR